MSWNEHRRLVCQHEIKNPNEAERLVRGWTRQDYLPCYGAAKVSVGTDTASVRRECARLPLGKPKHMGQSGLPIRWP
jgi:hypothetical protein